MTLFLQSAPLLPPPPVLGAPARFTEWRHGQDAAVLRTWTSDKRVIVHAMPTGSGKSLVYAVLAQMLETGKRAIILTSTKGLQDQVSHEFGDMVCDVRGAANYECEMRRDPNLDGAYSIFKVNNPDREPNCEEGACHSGRKCVLKENGCRYFDQYRAASRARVVLSNYSYWMAINRYSEEALGQFDTLILDEAHEAPDELAGFMRQELDEAEFERIGVRTNLPASLDKDEWRRWAGDLLPTLTELLEVLKRNPSAVKETRRTREAETKVCIISDMGDDWVVEDTTGYGYSRSFAFEPVWAAPYAERFLYCVDRGVKKVVLFSATVRPKTLELLGVQPGQFDFYEYPSPYPASRRPLIHVPTIRLNYKTTPGEMFIWLGMIDRIIRERLDRKGIVHTVSYDRMRYVVENSEHRARILWNDPKNGMATRDVVARFKAAGPGTVLVSPSVGTGYDFPGAECEYQIIGKLSYPDTRSPVMSARQAADKRYSSYLAMMDLIQATGRGMRGPKDQCETLIVDDNFKWFIKQNRDFAPQWFMDTVRWVDRPPVPLPKLR